MEKETDIRRRDFLKKSGLCAAAITLFSAHEIIASEDSDEIKRLKSMTNYFIERHAVMFDILTETLSPGDLKLVYNSFGGDCAKHWGSVSKTASYNGNLEQYLQDLPSLDQWQETAWFDEEKNLITIIGTKREECVCSMARKSDKANWCHLCCASHQKAIFENLLGKEVEVTMGETVLQGGERCNHFIRITDKEINS